MYNRKTVAAGFTIIELLITIAVLGITVPSLAGFIASINAMNDHARDLVLITSLAENKVEGLRSISFVGVNNGVVDFTNELPVQIGSPRQATYTVSSPAASLKQIDVEVTYEGYGGQRTYTYRTYLGELGVGQY